MNGGTESAETDPAAQEVALTPSVRTNPRGRVRTMLVSATTVVALVIGAYGLASSDSTQIDVAQQNDTTDSAAEPDADEPDADADASTEAEADGLDDAEIAESAIYRDDDGDGYEGSYVGDASAVVATDDGFVRLGWGPGGQTVETSTNGVEWQTVPVGGLTGDGALSLLTAYDGTYVAIYEEWPQYDEAGLDEAEPYFGDQGSATQYLASSTDLTTWSLSEFPDLASDSTYGAFASVSGLAVGESGVAAVVQSYSEPPDELRILFDAGVVDQAELVNFCGRDDQSVDTAIIYYSCDYSAMDPDYEEFGRRMDLAEDDEARAAIEREFEENFVEPEREILVTVEPGTALHAELMAVAEVRVEQSPTSVLEGPIGGPFTATELTKTGYSSGIVAIDGEFVTFVSDFDGRNAKTTVLGSEGGRWSELSVLEGQSINQAFMVGNNIVAVGGGQESGSAVLVWTSDDGGASWTESLGTDLFGAWADAVGGPAGVAIVLNGSDEPLPEYPEPVITIETDGFTLTTGLDGGRAILVGPDGETIYDLSIEELYDSAANDGAVRINGPTLVFVDPATGDDLVSFGEQLWEDAYSELTPDEVEFEEPTFTSQAFFSSDALSWTAVEIDLGHSENSNTQLAAVGDDEILFIKSTWSQPPAELLSFEQGGVEPSEAELAELEEWYSANDGGTTVEWIRVPLS